MKKIISLMFAAFLILGFISNANAKTLKANTSDAEGTSGKEIDFLSNGVKIRNSNNSINTSGSTYIYMVFAEEPLVASNGIPATAR